MAASKTSLLYSVVSRGTTVLAKHAACVGNFAEITEVILDRIVGKKTSLLDYFLCSTFPYWVAASISSDGRGAKRSYQSGPYQYHFLSCQDSDLIFLCITEQEFNQKVAFRFLERVRGQVTKNLRYSEMSFNL